MAGGNHLKPPPPSSSSSSSSHRKSRWEPNTAAAAATAKSPADPKPNNNNPKPPKPSPKTKPNNPNPNPSPNKRPSSDRLPLIPFPEPPSLPPPPPPAYGFHMLERRTIVLADGSVRSYFALPPDYHHLPPHRPPIDLSPAAGVPFDNRFPATAMSPSRFDRPRHPDYRNLPPPEASAKRKYGDEDVGRDELARQREQLLRNANLSNGFSGGPSELRPSKQLRVDGVGGGGGGGGGVKHHQKVDQEKLKKAFLHFAKLINENANQKKSYLEDGKQGRLQCIACGRFGRKKFS